TRQWLIALLAVATAAVHFSRAAADPEIRILFILNGLGYLALAAALFLPLPQLQAQRGRIRWAFIGYTAVTILFYLIWGFMSGEWTVPLGPIDKVIEIILITLLWQEK
ncbi:MAG: hypothetical protein L0322_15410, partial [Chloroflexi bacterium]|nr:hypothetical protein [Chloroflexota bacterium]